MTDNRALPPSLTMDHHSVFERLRSGHFLVTGNSRLSRVITHAYSEWRIGLGDLQWHSPSVLPWSAWLGQLWDSACLQGAVGTTRAVPGGRQLTNLWEQVLRADPESQVLLRPESLAPKLRDTRVLSRDWQLDFSHPSWFGEENENHTAFHRWNRAFEQLCEREHWLPPEDRTPHLCQAIIENRLSFEHPVDFLGFDEFNPSQLDLLDAMQSVGVPISRLVFPPRKTSALQWKSKDKNREMRQMSRWVRYWYEQEPAATIAVVVPDLEKRRDEVERNLLDILVPEQNPVEQGQIPWNISMGTPLAREPLIQTAFDLLKLLDFQIDIQEVGRVLRSPWLSGGRSERNNRALLEKCLRDNHPRQLKLSELRYRAKEMNRQDRQQNELPPELWEPQPWNCPKFTAVLDRLDKFQASHSRSLQPSAWAERLDQLLVSLGWPLKGDARSTEQNDRNWQALQAWRDGLRELSSLDATTDRLSMAAAIGQLQRISREKIFQPLTPPARIQVLGLYEISGLRFDHLWVHGLHNNNWPPPATPNPFIPRILQQKAQIPHSSPQRELEVARTITRRLLETSPDCVFSYPGQLDGEDVLPSPLLLKSSIETTRAMTGWEGDNWQHKVFNAPGAVIHPLLMPGPLTGDTSRGGSSILKHQALCPFRAFASNRLSAENLESPADGISPKLHGSLIHKVLEFFWQETRTQRALLELSDDELRLSVRQQVEKVVAEEIFLQQRPTFARVEADRLQRQALASLELDKTREPFSVVEFEKEILPVIEGQTIRLFIDRIDQTESGEDIIIDYKTGKVDPKNWFGDRPEDPQLPLYAISTSTTPAAVTFSVVRDDGCLYSGVVRREGLFPDLPPKASVYTQELIDAGFNMPETIVNWEQVLHQLMRAFLAGEATIDPKNGRKTCDNSFCELQRLCRIDELQTIQAAQEETGVVEDLI